MWKRKGKKLKGETISFASYTFSDGRQVREEDETASKNKIRNCLWVSCKCWNVLKILYPSKRKARTEGSQQGCPWVWTLHCLLVLKGTESVCRLLRNTTQTHWLLTAHLRDRLRLRNLQLPPWKEGAQRVWWHFPKMERGLWGQVPQLVLGEEGIWDMDVPWAEPATLCLNHGHLRIKSLCSTNLGLFVVKLECGGIHWVPFEGGFYQWFGTSAGRSTAVEDFPLTSPWEEGMSRDTCGWHCAALHGKPFGKAFLKWKALWVCILGGWFSLLPPDYVSVVLLWENFCQMKRLRMRKKTKVGVLRHSS